jgi:hypothetical protein
MKSRDAERMELYHAWVRGEDEMINNKFASENMKAREYFGR